MAMRYTLFGIGTLLLLGAGGFFLASYGSLPPQLPWLYSLPWGEAQLIPKPWFGLSLVAVLLATGINFLLSKRLAKNDQIAALVVEGATLLLILLYLASYIRVLLILI